MIINRNNKYFNLFIFDLYNGIGFFSYDCDYDIPRVVVSEKPEISVRDFGDHVNIIPFKMEDEDQFNDLVFQSLMKASELNRKVFDNFKDAAKYFEDNDIPSCRTLIGHNVSVDICKGLFNDIYYQYDKYWLYLIKNDNIADNEAYIITAPEYFGVIAAKTEGDGEQYAILIANTNGIVKVKLKE